MLSAMPKRSQNTLLHMHNVACADVLFQAMVDAGPGTEQDRSHTLQSVVIKGQAPPVHLIYDKLHKWRFDMSRLTALGVHPPDPGVQRNVLIHYVTKMTEADREFEYRLNACRATRRAQERVRIRWWAKCCDIWSRRLARSTELDKLRRRRPPQRARASHSSSQRRTPMPGRKTPS